MKAFNKSVVFIAAIFFVFCLFSNGAWAEEMNFTIDSYVTNMEMIPLADAEGHVLLLGERRGLANFEDGRVAAYHTSFNCYLTKGASPCEGHSDLTFMDDSNGTIFYSSSVSYSTRMEDGNMVFMTACTTDSERVPSLISYTSIDSEIIINKDGDEFVLALNGNILSMLVPNDFIAKDNETSETTVLQDVTYIYTKQ